MKEEYIRQVRKHLSLPRKRKQEVLRDLEEIFDSGAEHGETEQQVAERLGSPEEYAAGVRGPLEKRDSGRLLAGVILSCARCVVLLAAYFASRQPWLPKDAIGYAQGSTGILVLGAVDLSPLLLILAGMALVLAVFFTCRLIRKRKG